MHRVGKKGYSTRYFPYHQCTAVRRSAQLEGQETVGRGSIHIRRGKGARGGFKTKQELFPGPFFTWKKNRGNVERCRRPGAKEEHGESKTFNVKN